MPVPVSVAPLCLHCERRPRAGGSALCAACDARASIRVLYRRRRDWTPAWEAHLRRLTARAAAGLPLFDDP